MQLLTAVGSKLCALNAAGQHPGLRPDVAFAKLFESEEVVRRAVAVAKAWPQPMSLEPMVATGTDAFPSTRLRPGSATTTHEDENTGESDWGDAYAQLVAMAERQRRAGESQAAAFARVYADPANRSLVAAERAQNQPNAEYTNVSPEPTPTVEKSATNGAYKELMAKAKALQAATGLTEAQAFEKVFVDPANRALAARERQENTPITYGQ